VDKESAVFWVVALCSVVDGYQRYEGPCCLHHGALHYTAQQPRKLRILRGYVFHELCFRGVIFWIYTHCLSGSVFGNYFALQCQLPLADSSGGAICAMPVQTWLSLDVRDDGRLLLDIFWEHGSGIRAGWSGGSSSTRGWVFFSHHRVQTDSGTLPVSYPMGTRGSFLRGKVTRGVKLATHLHLMPRSRMRGATPPLPQYVSMAWFSVKAQGQLYFLTLWFGHYRFFLLDNRF
jgi:hypothetical protein